MCIEESCSKFGMTVGQFISGESSTSSKSSGKKSKDLHRNLDDGKPQRVRIRPKYSVAVALS